MTVIKPMAIVPDLLNVTQHSIEQSEVAKLKARIDRLREIVAGYMARSHNKILRGEPPCGCDLCERARKEIDG